MNDVLAQRRIRRADQPDATVFVVTIYEPVPDGRGWWTCQYSISGSSEFHQKRPAPGIDRLDSLIMALSFANLICVNLSEVHFENQLKWEHAEAPGDFGLSTRSTDLGA